MKDLKLLPHPGTRSRGDIGTMFLCTSQRCRRCASNETPNDASVERHQGVSVVRLYDVWLECRDDFSSWRLVEVPSVCLHDVSKQVSNENPTTSQWYISTTSH